MKSIHGIENHRNSQERKKRKLENASRKLVMTSFRHSFFHFIKKNKEKREKAEKPKVRQETKKRKKKKSTCTRSFGFTFG